jgi:hypothetical protein
MTGRKPKIHYKFRDNETECGFPGANTTDILSKVTCFLCLTKLGLRKVRK